MVPGTSDPSACWAAQPTLASYLRLKEPQFSIPLFAGIEDQMYIPLCVMFLLPPGADPDSSGPSACLSQNEIIIDCVPSYRRMLNLRGLVSAVSPYQYLSMSLASVLRPNHSR